MALWLDMCTALAEDLSLVPRSHSGNSKSLVAPAPGEPVPCDSLNSDHISTHEQIFIHRYLNTYDKLVNKVRYKLDYPKLNELLVIIMIL